MALALTGTDRLALPENLKTCLAEARSSLLALEEALKEAWEDRRSGQEDLLAERERRCSEAEVAATRLQKELGTKASLVEELQGRLAEGERLLQKREEETKKLQAKVRKLEEAAAPRAERPPKAAPAEAGAAAEKDGARPAAGRGPRSSPSARRSSERGRGAARASPPRQVKKESPPRRVNRRSPSRGSPSRRSPGRRAPAERSRSRDRRAPAGRSRSRRRKASLSRSRSRDSRSRSPTEPPGKDERAPPAAGRSDQGPLCIPFVMGNCLAGDKCRNRHPRDDDLPNAREALKRKVCKFGADCKRRDCIFVHPGRDDAQRPRQAAAADPRDGRGADRVAGRAGWSQPGKVDRQCRYGASCKRPDCKFQHP